MNAPVHERQLEMPLPAELGKRPTPVSAEPAPAALAAAGPDPVQGEFEMLSTELLDNRRCRSLVPDLNEFENEVFGPDFACDRDHLQTWVESGCLLYSAVTGEAVAGRRRVLSTLSVFITTAAARDQMLLGQISDFEMTPWTAADRTQQPALYLSSVISVAPRHLAAMYQSLLRDVLEFRDTHGLVFHGGFAVAAAPAGRRHMGKCGFRLLDGHAYRGVYDLMVIDARTATSPFWATLLNDGTTFLQRADAAHAVEASSLAQPPISQDTAREVERRLARAKADRLRGKLDY